MKSKTNHNLTTSLMIGLEQPALEVQLTNSTKDIDINNYAKSTFDVNEFSDYTQESTKDLTSYSERSDIKIDLGNQEEHFEDEHNAAYHVQLKNDTIDGAINDYSNSSSALKVPQEFEKDSNPFDINDNENDQDQYIEDENITEEDCATNNNKTQEPRKEIWEKIDQNQFLNTTNSSDIECETTSGEELMVGFEVAFPILCAVVSLLALVVLKKYLKNLNEVIKNILIALNLHNLASSIVTTSILIFWNDKNSILERCNTLQIMTHSNALIAIQTLGLISYAKYYLAWKTAKLEATNTCIIIGLAASVYVTGYSITSTVTLTTMTSFTSTCIRNKDENQGNKLVPLFYAAFSVIVVAIGFVYDASLYFFLKKRQQMERGAGQSGTIPWKSSNQEEYKYSIPIGASAVALTTGIVCLTLCAVVLSLTSNVTYYIVYGLGYILPSMLTAAMLGLTIRTAWNQKPKPTIPKGPCFHDDGNEDDVEDGHDNDGFEQVPEANPAQVHHEQENNESNEDNEEGEVLGANALPMHNIIFVKPFRAESDENNMSMESAETPQKHLEKIDEEEG